MASFEFTVVAVSPDRAASDHNMRARMPESVSTALLGPKERSGSVPEIPWYPNIPAVAVLDNVLFVAGRQCGEIVRRKLDPVKPAILNSQNSSELKLLRSAVWVFVIAPCPLKRRGAMEVVSH